MFSILSKTIKYVIILQWYFFSIVQNLKKKIENFLYLPIIPQKWEVKYF